MHNVPKELKGKILRRLIRRIVVCAAMYALIYYCFLYRYSYKYFIENIGGILSGILFTILLALPYFLSGLHGYVMDRSYEGTVIKVRRTRELKPLKGGIVWYSTFLKEQCIVVRATVELDNGDVIERVIRRYDIDDLAQSLCQVGDRVRHLKGAPFTQIYGVGKRHDIDCVWCGFYSDKRYENCERCGAPILPWLDVELPKNEEGLELREALREEEPQVRAHRYTGPDVVDVSEVHDTVIPCSRPVRAAEDIEFEVGEVTPTPEFGTYKRSVDFFDFLALFGVSIAGMAVTGYISLIITKVMEKNADKWVFAAVVAGIIPLAISIYYLRSYPPNHFRKTERIPAWLRQGCLFVLPSEILRLFVSAVPIFGNAFGCLFSPLSHLWWYLYHMLPSERLEELESGIYIAEDYDAYFSVAIPAMLLRTAILFAAYYYFWRKYEKERELMFNEKNGRV